MQPIPKLLSKTKLLRGFRCLKYLYLTIHRPTLEAPITKETQALFDQGNTVGNKAREYYDGGILVDNKPWDFIGAIARTRDLIANNTETIYEAAFEYIGCYARIDILQYIKSSKRWRIIEVKSTTKIKPEHYDDIALQAWIVAKTGLPIETIHLAHLNPACTYPDLSDLFIDNDITDKIREKYLTIQPALKEIVTAIRQEKTPNIDIGPYCLAPSECGFKEHCWQHIPKLSIFNLPQIKNRKWDFYQSGMTELDDPRLTDLTDIQGRMVTCFKTGERYINREAIAHALNKWQFPLVFLDFETINDAIPRFAGCKPYSHVPFQFSVHIWQTPDSDITHHAFLHDTTDDPRPTLIPKLLAACEEEGSIVAYFSQFEGERIEALAEYAPHYQIQLMNLIERLVDPLPIIREAIYDNTFAGSFSLKSVAPALLGTEYSYDDMLVANGNDAQRAFAELIDPKTSTNQKSVIKEAMLDYCKKDTFVMLKLVQWLYQQIQETNPY